MRVSVSDSNLRLVLSRFRSKPEAKVEFVLSEDGLDIVGNAEGYRTLARWCLVMAHPDMEDHADPEWLHAAYHLDQVFTLGKGVSVVSCKDGDSRRLPAHDVRLYRSRVTGKRFWQGTGPC